MKSQLTIPYITVTDLAARWGVSIDAIGALGADGRLRFGCIFPGTLILEFCRLNTAGDGLEVIDTEAVRGFVYVTPETVSAAWQGGVTDRIEIPNTDSGELVRVSAYIPFSDEGDELRVVAVLEDALEIESARASNKTPEERGAALKTRLEELKNSGVRAPLQALSTETRLSKQRIGQLIKRASGSGTLTTPKPASLAGMLKQQKKH